MISTSFRRLNTSYTRYFCVVWMKYAIIFIFIYKYSILFFFQNYCLLSLVIKRKDFCARTKIKPLTLYVKRLTCVNYDNKKWHSNYCKSISPQIMTLQYADLEVVTTSRCNKAIKSGSETNGTAQTENMFSVQVLSKWLNYGKSMRLRNF